MYIAILLLIDKPKSNAKANILNQLKCNNKIKFQAYLLIVHLIYRSSQLHIQIYKVWTRTDEFYWIYFIRYLINFSCCNDKFI